MRIIAKHQLVSDIPEDIRNYAYNQDGNHLPLTLGNKYIVAGIRKTHGHTFYFILDDYDKSRGFSWWFPSELFDVDDDARPDDWVEGGLKGVDEYLTFPELANGRTDTFESNLEEGNAPEIAIFMTYYQKYRKAYEGLNPMVSYHVLDETRSSQFIQFDPQSNFLVTVPDSFLADRIVELVTGDLLTLEVGLHHGKVFGFGGFTGPKEMWETKKLDDISPVPADIIFHINQEDEGSAMAHNCPLSDVTGAYDPEKHLLRFGKDTPDHEQLLVFQNLVIGLDKIGHLNSIYVMDI